MYSDIVVLSNYSDLTTLSDGQLKHLLAQDCILRTKRAYCLMFTNDLYQMHLNLLSSFLETSKRAQRAALHTLISHAQGSRLRVDDLTNLLSQL